jgi:hypothetical protein
VFGADHASLTEVVRRQTGLQMNELHQGDLVVPSILMQHTRLQSRRDTRL